MPSGKPVSESVPQGFEPYLAPLSETAARARQGQMALAALLDSLSGRIGELNPALNAFISTQAPPTPDRLSAEGPLAGIPFSIKDLIRTRDLPTTGGSKVFGAGFQSRRDAPLVSRLRKAGAIILGKTNLHEFAYGVTNENAHYGAARNPWNSDRVAGGSSGGSAVSLAAGMVLASIGTDTRGSIRIPAAFCGITGLKPTRGRISTRGVIPLSPLLDHVGPMTRTVADAALVFSVLDLKGDRLPTLPQVDLSIRLGVCPFYLAHLDTEILRAVEAAVEQFRSAGYSVQEVEIAGLDEACQASTVIVSVEALAFHREQLAACPEGYDPAVRGRIEAGERFSAVEMVEALQSRRRLKREFRRIFKQVDCLLGAAVPAFPPRIGDDFVEIDGCKEPIVENLVRFNAPQNMAGIPALVLPCGHGRKGLPIAMQLIAGRHREKVLFSLGRHYQQLTDWHRFRPGLPPRLSGA